MTYSSKRNYAPFNTLGAMNFVRTTPTRTHRTHVVWLHSSDSIKRYKPAKVSSRDRTTTPRTADVRRAFHIERDALFVSATRTWRLLPTLAATARTFPGRRWLTITRNACVCTHITCIMHIGPNIYITTSRPPTTLNKLTIVSKLTTWTEYTTKYGLAVLRPPQPACRLIIKLNLFGHAD